MKISYSFTYKSRSLYSAIGLISLVFFFIKFILPVWKEIMSFNAENIKYIWLFWCPNINYILMALIICLAINTFKPKPLKSWEEKGIVLFLIRGYFFSFLLGLFWWTVLGLYIGYELSWLLAGLFITSVGSCVVSAYSTIPKEFN